MIFELTTGGLSATAHSYCIEVESEPDTESAPEPSTTAAGTLFGSGALYRVRTLSLPLPR